MYFFVGHVVIYEKAPGFNVTIQVISRLDLEKNTLSLVSIPKLPMPTNLIEKNWAYFTQDQSQTTRSHLYCIQNLYCPSIFKTYSLSHDWVVEQKVHDLGQIVGAPISPTEKTPNKALVSLSANPIWVEGKFLVFYHIKTPAYQYLNYVCVPGKPLPNSPFLASNKAQGKSSGVVYVSSAIYLKKRQLIRVYFGEGDAHSSYLDFDSQIFMKSINPQIFMKSINPLR